MERSGWRRAAAGGGSRASWRAACGTWGQTGLEISPMGEKLGECLSRLIFPLCVDPASVLCTHPLPPADPSREAPLQGGRVGCVPQQLHVRLLQVILCHVVFFQSHITALIPRPSQHHHVATAARNLDKETVHHFLYII